jgi:ABC-type branched-subunit amino acid transport system substrate-binding protein
MPDIAVLNRRQLLRTAAVGAAAIAAPAIITTARAADTLKIGIFVADTGPAALFGPAQRAASTLGGDAVNAAGGIHGRQVEIVFADGGASPAEAAKAAIRLMLSEKVGMIFGSHDSAVRQALEGAIKGKVPYVYTPVYEGKDCASATWYLGETPEQQIEKSIAKLVSIAGGKSFYLVGNDYVWPRTTNEEAKKYIAKVGGTVVGEEYYPLGAANNFESTITKIKTLKPAIVLQTVVGGDNVGFNRAFADFGLSDTATRMSCLLEENTLAGIGKDASKNLYSCMGYFADISTQENKAFLAAAAKKFGDKAPQQCTISKGLYDAFTFSAAAAAKAKSLDAAALAKAADGMSFDTPSGTMTVQHRHTKKNMFFAGCDGTSFKIVDTFEGVPSGQACT